MTSFRAAGATLLQWALKRAGALAAGMEPRSAPFAELVFAAVGSTSSRR